MPEQIRPVSPGQRRAVILVGAAILDVLARPAGPEVFASGSVPAEEICLSVGGDALNEATILARLGAEVFLQTVVGEDMAGQVILRHCRNCGISLLGHPVRAGLTTGINIVLIQANGERSFLTNPNGSLRSLRLGDLSLSFPPQAGILCLASIFVSPHLRTKELSALFCAARVQGLTVCADLTRPKHGERLEDLAEALRYVDFLFPNEGEAIALTGAGGVEQAAEQLHRAGVGHVVIKCGARGCYLRDGQFAQYVPAASGVRCIDTTGAGDSFAAGFLFALSRGWDMLACARFANACGAHAVASTGSVAWAESLTSSDVEALSREALSPLSAVKSCGSPPRRN